MARCPLVSTISLSHPSFSENSCVTYWPETAVSWVFSNDLATAGSNWVKSRPPAISLCFTFHANKWESLFNKKHDQLLLTGRFWQSVCVCIRLFELCCMLCTSACDTWSSSEHQTSNLFTHSRFIETVCLGYIVWGKKSTNIGAVPNLESIRGGCRSIPLLGLVTIALHPEQHATELAGLRSGWETSMMENKK